MAKYQIFISLRSGAGQALINGEPITTDGYEEGTTLSFNWVTSQTYTDIEVSTRGDYIPVQNTPFFTFTMPARDVTFTVNLFNWVIPATSYGLKYYYEWCDTLRNPKRLEIRELNYTGASEKRLLNDVVFRFGDRDSNPTETFIFSSLDMTFVTTGTEYYEFLTGDIRKYQAILYHGSDIFFKGFIKPDYVTSPEKTNVTHEVKLTAFDGMDDFGAIRFKWSEIEQRVNLDGFQPFSQPAIKAIARALNQSYKEGRVINISCDLYETRMDNSEGMFEQWAYGENAIFNDGKNPRFVEDGSRRVVNEELDLEQVLTRLINPFLCNIYLWEDQFYIVRIEELTKDNIRFFRYQANSEFDESYTLANDQDDDCILANGLRTGRTVYTEFTASLRLGVLFDVGSGDFDSTFDLPEWIEGRTSTGAIAYVLRQWAYVKTVAYNTSTNSPRTGDTASVQYWTEDGNEYARMWTTTNSSGLSDPNLSYIEKTLVTGGIQPARDGSQPPFIAVGEANIIVFESDWVLRRSASTIQQRRPTGYRIAFQIQVGRYYLYQDAQLFDWTLTPTIINFAINSEINAMNQIRLVTEPIPESGEVILRLYQLINTNSTGKDNYLIDWNFANIKVQENSALVLSEIQKKAITQVPFSKVYPIYQTYLGDSITNKSTSAMRLLTGEVTETWGIEEESLLENIVQELAALFGRSNVSVYGNMVREIWKPYKALRYKNRYWKINHMLVNETKGEISAIDLFDLGPLPDPDLDVTLSWSLDEGIPNIYYIDANMRIYVNEVLFAEVWSNDSGTIPATVGDTVRIQWFFLQGLIDPGIEDPYLQLFINGDLVEEHPIDPNSTQTYNHVFVASSSSYTIFVRSTDKA